MKSSSIDHVIKLAIVHDSQSGRPRRQDIIWTKFKCFKAPVASHRDSGRG